MTLRALLRQMKVIYHLSCRANYFLFNVQEGQQLVKDSVVGTVDALNISLQQQQVEANIKALNEKTLDVTPQVQLLQNQEAVQQSQLLNLQHEKQE